MKHCRLYILVTLLALLAAGQTNAWAANTWKVEYDNGKFKISRSGDLSITETVQYRTVSLSAFAGQHFTAISGTETFGPNQDAKEISVSEATPGTDAYLYQNGTSRKYRFEVLDQGGFRLAFMDRTITTGTSVPTDVFSQKTGTIRSSEFTINDSGYKQSGNPYTINRSSFYNDNAKNYLSFLGVPLHMTLELQAKEVDDAYQYLQVIIDNTTACDSETSASKGNPGTPSISSYMAGFEMYPSHTHADYKTYTFPVANIEDGKKVNDPWGYGTNFPLSMQKFKNGSRSTDYKIIVPNSFNTISVRFDASGSEGSDEWKVQNLKAKITAIDGTAPSRLGDPIVSGSTHAKGNTFYVSVPFDEIVTVTGTPTLSTTWGSASYVSSNGGSGSNVLTFSGTITASAGTALTVQTISGTIKDLANNELSSSSKTINKSYGTTVDASHSFTITYNLDGGAVATDNPTSYTWETAAFTLNIPAKTGYWFDGWTGSNGNTPSTTVTIANHSHENKTYTAHWTQVWTGSGAQGDPYVISSPQGLDLLAQYVNGLNGNTPHDCNEVCFQLGDDITYSYTTNWNNASSTENNYTAIGTDDHSFQGTFDGQGHTVSGIRLYRGGNDSADSRQGLFGVINTGGTVKNLTISDARITGKSYVGGIAGNNFKATVEDCTVAADVCIQAVQMDSKYHGGIVGSNQGSVLRCLSRATLTADYTSGCHSFGGIAGNTNGNTIQDCLVFEVTVPDVTDRGALIGVASSTVRRNYYRNCTVAGLPEATGVGVGYSTGNTSPHDLTTNQGAQALYSLTLPEGVTLVRTASATLPGTGNATYTTGADIDGIPYAYDGATLTLSYTGATPAEGYNRAIYVNDVLATDNGNGTYTATMPAADATVTIGQTPILSYFWGPNDGDSQDHPYTISTTAGLNLLATLVNKGNDFSGKYFALANDITYTHTTDWNDVNSTENNFNTIGGYNGGETNKFQGTFDGKGHTVSGIRIYMDGDNNVDSWHGIFGTVGSNGTVRNLTVSNARITGFDNVGGITGLNLGTVYNCHASPTVNIHAVQSYSSNHGGIAGQNGRSILGCTSAVTLSVNNGCTNCDSFGGITGLHGTTYSKTNQCLSVGVVISPVDNAGAIIGNNFLGSLNYNFYHDCFIGGNTTNIGTGYNGDTNSARPGYTVTCSTGITATAEGSIYESFDDFDGLTEYYYDNGNYGITYNGNSYYDAGIEFSLSGTGSAPAGYQEPFLGYSLNGTPIDGNTFTMPAADATVTARWTVADFETGHAGTEADPYIIYNKDQLNLLATRVNSGTNYSGKFIKLGADITYDGTENNYTPIGNGDKGFRGNFDGDGHTISGISVRGETDYKGLFGKVYAGAVTNVVLAKCNFSGEKKVGGIAGVIMLNSTISNCRVEGTVTIAGEDIYSGGIVGYSSTSHIVGCLSAATVSGNSINYGGIVGYNSDKNVIVQNCLAIGCNITGSSAGAISGADLGVFSNNYYANCTVSGFSSNKGCYNGDVTDNDGAVRAVSSTTRPAEIGAQIASYSNGLTVYEHGAYYNGTYYLRHDLAGTAVGLNLTQGTKDGVTAWWGTFYDGTTNHTLSEGTAAYTLGTDYKLYRLGDDGRTIPAGTAVVIIAASADAAIVPAGTAALSITDHAPGGNILVGNDTAMTYPTVYVLSVSAGEVGFRKLSGGTLPAHKAGYQQQAGMKNYDRQGNQNW